MKKETVNELKNFFILFLSVISTLFFFILPNQTGYSYFLATKLQNIRIKLGMIPDTLLHDKLPIPILLTNVLTFISLNILFGSLAYLALNRRTKRNSSTTYGLLMPIFFLLITFPYAIFSDDKGSGPFAFIGALVISVIQIPLSNLILRDQVSSVNRGIYE